MDPGSHHRVRVSHVESPHYFCVQTASWCDGPLDRMQKDLWRSAWNQPIGDDNPGTPVGPLTLTEGLRCSAVSFRHNAWVRVQVDRVNDDGKVQVFLLDWGGTEKMNRSQLRSLPEHCQKIPPIALRCFLPDLRPTGDDSRWSSSTCEFMADYLVGKFCFITQSKDSGRESQDSGVIPVEVFVGSSARLLSNFRDVLIKQGLALPRRKIEGNLELVRVRKQCEQAPDESLICNLNKTPALITGGKREQNRGTQLWW
uniref:Tudor domain-containing protein n=1 Tax=Eptatretus burgeri TaxID=7764 RepID=A0A8C4QH33_EPTBU